MRCNGASASRRPQKTQNPFPAKGYLLSIWTARLKASRKSGSAASTRFQLGIHRVAQRIVEIFTRSAPDAAHKGADRQLFPVAIISQPVNLGVSPVESHCVLSLAHVGAQEGIEDAPVELDAMSSQSEKNALHDIHSHLVEPLLGVAWRKFLVLVVVAFRDIHLANALGRGYTEDLGEDADLNTRIRRECTPTDHVWTGSFPRSAGNRKVSM